MTPRFAEVKALPHVIVIHRWQDKYADYARYVDHDRYAVSYISTEVGLASIPDAAAKVSVVSHPDDLAEVRIAVASHVAVLGPLAGVVALKEDDLLVAARLRTEQGCPGPRYADLLLFRDKYMTCRAATQAGLSVPEYAPISGPREVRAFGNAHGWPVVVKPRASSASEGVVVLHDPDSVRSVEFSDGRPRMAQVFDERQIYHVDGLCTKGRLGPWKASRYINNCLDFRAGRMLGSVEEDDPEVLATIGAFTQRLMDALANGPVVFHLEVFLAGRECALLEVGARAGGAEIVFLWREVHRIDLMRAAFDIQLGRIPQEAGIPAGTGRVAGWLLVPAPDTRPCLITEVTSMTGRKTGPYAEAIPSPGAVLPAADSYYEHVGGRFRFQGKTTEEVESSIAATAKAFRVRGAPLDVVTAEAGR